MASQANNPGRGRPPFRAPGPSTPSVPDVPAPNGAARPINTNAPYSHEGGQHFPTTEAGVAPHVSERANVADGESRPRKMPGEVWDAFYLSQADKDEYGIPDAVPSTLADTVAPGTLVYTAMRSPEAYDRIQPRQLQRKKHVRPSLQVVRDAQGNPVGPTHDLIYIVESREDFLERKAKHNDAAWNFTNGVINGSLDNPDTDGTMETFREGNMTALRRKKHETRQRFAGMKTNWPPEMSISEIEAKMGVERTIELERRWARNGRTEQPGEYEAWAERQDAAAKAKKSKKVFSFPGQPAK